MTPAKHPVGVTRLRLAHRLVLTAAEVDPSLHTCTQWMKVMVNLQMLLERARSEPDQKGWEEDQSTRAVIFRHLETEKEIEKVA